MSIDYQALKDYIAADPTYQKYLDAGEDEVLAKMLNSGSEEINLEESRITKHDFHNLFGFVRTVQIIATVKTFIKANPADPKAFALEEILWLLETPPGLNIGHADAGKEVGGLVTATIITQEEGDTLLAKGKRLVSTSEKQFGRTLSYQDVAKVRELK